MSDTDFFVEERAPSPVWVFAIMSVALTMIMGSMDWLLIQDGRAEAIALAQFSILPILALWALTAGAWYLDYMHYHARDTIPLVREQITVETRTLSKSHAPYHDEYVVIGTNGVVYRAVSQAIFARAVPGSTVTGIVKHYPEETHEKPLLTGIV